MNPTSRHDNDDRGRVGRTDRHHGDQLENRHPQLQQAPPYASMGTYSSMVTGHHHYQYQQYQHQYQQRAPLQDSGRDRHHGLVTNRDHANERDSNDGDYRRSDSGNSDHSPKRATGPICKFFLQGYCFRGDSCRFRHENSNSRGPNEERQHHNQTHSYYERSDSNSNRSVTSDVSSVDEFGRVPKHFPESRPAAAKDRDYQAIPLSESSEKFWSKVNMNEKAPQKTSTNQAIGGDLPNEPTKKKTISWGNDSTVQIREKNFCNIPGHDHLWSECPDNKFSRNYKANAAPALTAEESNAMFRAALSKNASSGTAAMVATDNKPDYSARIAPDLDNSDKPCAVPKSTVPSINSLYGSLSLKNNTLRHPPTVVASNAVNNISRISITATSPTKSKSASLAGATIPRRSAAESVPRRGTTELGGKSSLFVDTAPSKLKPAAQLKTPLAQNGQHKKTFISRSARGLAKRPSPEEPSLVEKKRKLQSASNLLTNPVRRMTCKNGQWRKVGAPVAPLGNGAIPIAKHKSTRLLSRQINPFDNQNLESDELESEANGEDDEKSMADNDDSGTNLDFDNCRMDEDNEEDHLAEKTSRNEPSDEKQPPLGRTSNPEVICIESSAEEEDAEEASKGDGTCDEQSDAVDRKFQDSLAAYDAPTEQTNPATCGQAVAIFFADEQVDEMEADLLGWAEHNAKRIASYNPASFDGRLPNDESSVSDEASSEDFGGGYNSGSTAGDHSLQTGTTKPVRNIPRDSSSSSNGSTQSQILSSHDDSFGRERVQTELKSTQRSEGSPVTPSPLVTVDGRSHSTGHNLNDLESSVADRKIPSFCTCNKCHLVFDHYRDAVDHENSCTSKGEQCGRVFQDVLELTREARMRDLKCYFKPRTINSSTSCDMLLSHQPSHSLQKQDSLPAARRRNNAQTWDIKYAAVDKFMKENGHLKLPNESIPELGNLYQWLAQQKNKLSKGTLNINRAAKLNKLGLDFELTPPSDQSPKQNWIRKYEAVRKFMKDNGHLDLPKKPIANLGNLYQWFASEKSKLRSGTLSPKRMLKLKKLVKDSKLSRAKKSTKDEDVCVLQSLDHLCSTEISAGLPRQRIVIIDSQTEVLQSSIVGSGRGVFLTYLGAKVLNPKANARLERLLSEHVLSDPLLCHQLTAITQEGKRMTVTISPDSVHLNENNVLWSKQRSAAYDTHIRQDPHVDFDENSVACSVHDEVKTLRSYVPYAERIGQLGINSLSDYVDDDTTSFWSRHLVELGRYGPFRPEDRKPELHFIMKNFLCDYEPHEWAYSTDENGNTFIDITDDTTGQIHDLARQHTSVYVNEVGHVSDLHENVLIREKGEGAVYYYISIDEQHAMKKGDTVELLVNYGKHYEGVRERKGYGLVNRQEGLGGDWDDKARLQRNFVERKDIENEIDDLTFMQLWVLAEFLTEKIYHPIKESMGRRCTESRHIIARRRLHWLAQYFERHLDSLFQASSSTNLTMLPGIVSVLRNWLREWHFTSDSIDHGLLTNKTDSGKTAKGVILDEISEELLYDISFRVPKPLLPHPMDESLWNKVAVSLTKHCATNIAFHIFTRSNIPTGERLSNLFDLLLQGAVSSADAVRNGARVINQSVKIPVEGFERAVSLLAFKSLRRQVSRNQNQAAERKSSSLGKSNVVNVYESITPFFYGEAAALAEIQAYQDAIDLCWSDGANLTSESIKPSDSTLTLISKYHSDKPLSPGASQFLWMPRTVDAFKEGVAKVNEEWYLLHQVLLVVHALACSIDWNCNTPSGERPIYSLERMCLALGIDLKKAEATISHAAPMHILPIDIKKKSPMKARKSVLKAKIDSRGEKVTKVTPKAAGHPNRTIRDGPDDRFPGWNIRSIRRISSDTVDNIWYRPDHEDIKVRSTKGVKHIMRTMAEESIDFITACMRLYQTVGKVYFQAAPQKVVMPQRSASTNAST
ncbi:hypothetical protein HJC23_014039 [Cyclotella cryptica]|uniref:C3H1-type domain-containing protein n=1 Tax=Cyclotella cryptica TaxID=29204 RepID=A0ABD3QU49_9STRA